MRNGLPVRIPVVVSAEDPVCRAGVESQLRFRSEVTLLKEADYEQASVAVVVADQVTEDVLRTVRVLQRSGGARVLLLVASIDDLGLDDAVKEGVSGILWRGEASAERLVTAVQAVLSGDGSLPPDLLGRLLRRVGAAQRHVLPVHGLTLGPLKQRERNVMRLVADGKTTREVAAALCYSERTVKNDIRDLCSRLQLRNRAHAVAYLVQAGLI